MDDSCIETFLHVHVEGIARLTSSAVCIFLCHLTDVDEIHIIIHTQMHIFLCFLRLAEWDPPDELQSVVVATLSLLHGPQSSPPLVISPISRLQRRA